ncbi:MAG: protein adenylyltransferase SelO family protein [Arenicellales bacterium]
MDPYAMCYGGHQFGNWAGQQGDGRVINKKGERWALPLKGADPTPYSRNADGLAVLRSSVREFPVVRQCFTLAFPTTRALSLVLIGEQVTRDIFYDGNPALEPGAVVCRVAPSILRFGNFEILASREDTDTLGVLLDYTLRKSGQIGPMINRVALCFPAVPEQSRKFVFCNGVAKETCYYR